MNATHAIFQALGDSAILMLLVPWLGSHVIRYRARQVIAQDEDCNWVYYSVFAYACYVAYRLIEIIRWHDLTSIDPVRTLAVVPVGIIGIFTVVRIMKLRHKVKIYRNGEQIDVFEPPSSKVKIYGSRKISGV